MDKSYIIAEIGINHNGSLENALKLIDIAAAAGCDAVKFQKRNPDVCVPEDQKNVLRNTPWGEMKYIDYKYKMEFGFEEYKKINEHCINKGIKWTASVWDLDSVDFLSNFDVPFVKIPSAMLTNDELLVQCVKNFDWVILSTGMSTEKEIEHAVKILEDNNDYSRISLLHCNSSYPAPIDELNLSAIKTLRSKYPHIEIGYSGHELTLGTTVASVLLGASIIERHITLDRNMWGSDHACSVTPWGLFKLVNGIRELEKAYGNGELRVELSEIPSLKKLRG